PAIWRTGQPVLGTCATPNNRNAALRQGAICTAPDRQTPTAARQSLEATLQYDEDGARRRCGRQCAAMPERTAGAVCCALKRDGDALANADAHRRQCTTSTGQRQLQSHGAGDPSTRHAKRMAERNGTTV